MIVYLDASALVKRYVAETDSDSVNSLIAQSSAVGTAAISRAEIAAAFAKAVRMKALTGIEAKSALQAFNSEWESLIRIQITDILIGRAANLAWEHGLRGYDSIHLAAAIFWQEMLGEPVTLATFARQLWKGAQTGGLTAWPDGLV
jgi:uncharacterized protein